MIGFAAQMVVSAFKASEKTAWVDPADQIVAQYLLLNHKMEAFTGNGSRPDGYALLEQCRSLEGSSRQMHDGPVLDCPALRRYPKGIFPFIFMNSMFSPICKALYLLLVHIGKNMMAGICWGCIELAKWPFCRFEDHSRTPWLRDSG